MASTSTAWADSDVSVEVSIDGPRRAVGVRAYTRLLDQVLFVSRRGRSRRPARTSCSLRVGSRRSLV